VKGCFANTIFLSLPPVKKKCEFTQKVSFKLHVLICVKLSEVCENKDQSVIIQKYELFYANN
jgi:hypothetical protein